MVNGSCSIAPLGNTDSTKMWDLDFRIHLNYNIPELQERLGEYLH